jgi:DNA repair exonuclease SbcCD ATPase subunit
MESNQNPQKQNGTSKLLIVLLIASLGLNAYLFTSKNTMQDDYKVEKDSLITARVDVEKELTDTYTELNQYKGINSRLDSLLSEANGKVDEQKAKIDALIKREGNSKKLNKELQAELAELKKLRDQYLEKIDALLVENEQLKKDKNELTTTVESLTKNLESTVTTASLLRAEYLKINSFKKRNNDKYTSTVMAKRTNKIDACFTILENKIAKSGSKTVYLRILEPGGKVIGNRSEGSSSFKLTGTNEDVLYTMSKTVDYTNDKQDVCIIWEEADRTYAPGSYMVEVYIEGSLSGVSSLTLR